jgi:hypothetical protein
VSYPTQKAMDDTSKDIVVSVPHSGTRSLCTHLELFEVSTVGDKPRFHYLHWGQNDADIEILTGQVHIPIRNPIDIARSWDGRYRGNGGDTHTIENMLWRLDRMLAFIDSYPDRVLYRVEDLDIRAGKGDERSLEDTPRVIATRQWLSDKMDFYGSYYAD